VIGRAAGLMANIPGGSGLADTRMSPFWILLELRMKELVVTSEAIRCAKLQSNHHHQQTNTQEGRACGLNSHTSNPQWYTFGTPTEDPAHSLANKTVVQPRPKSTTRSSFLLEYFQYFCRRYDR